MMCEQNSCVGKVREACDWEADDAYAGEKGGYMVYNYTGYDPGTWWDYDTLVYFED